MLTVGLRCISCLYQVSTWDEDMWWHYPLVCGIIVCCQQRTQVLNGCSCWWMGTQQSNWWRKKGKRASLSRRERRHAEEAETAACLEGIRLAAGWPHFFSGISFSLFLPAKGRAFFICPCLSVNSIGHLNSYIYILPIYINTCLHTCPALISSKLMSTYLSISAKES